jgi:hypothetical protein
MYSSYCRQAAVPIAVELFLKAIELFAVCVEYLWSPRAVSKRFL